MKESKGQKRRDKRKSPDGEDSLTELLASYAPKQRETLLKGFRILAKVAVRAHIERQAAGPTPRRIPARRRADGYPSLRTTGGLLLNLSVGNPGACYPLTVSTTNNTFDTLAFALTRENEVSQWFLNVAAPARPTSAALTNTFGGGSRPKPNFKARQSVRSSMRFSTATSARRTRRETAAVLDVTR